MDQEAVEKLKAECTLYHDTVTFFSVVNEFSKKNGIPIDIERDFLSPDGSKKLPPDFSLVQGDSVVDVIEHKGALSANPQAAYDELMEVATKYAQLQHNGILSTPEITVLYPVCSETTVRQIQPTLPANIALCSFDQCSSDDEIGIAALTQPRSKLVNDIIAKAPIKYDPATTRSKYRYIKASPPLIYTAYQVRSQFYIYRDVKSARRDEYSVSRQKLLDDAQTFYPPWIRNNLQLNSSRTDSALTFLDSIGFISWSGEDEIIVYPKKGSRSGDQLDYFARKFVGAAEEREKKKLPRRKPEPISKPQEQLTLRRFE